MPAARTATIAGCLSARLPDAPGWKRPRRSRAALWGVIVGIMLALPSSGSARGRRHQPSNSADELEKIKSPPPLSTNFVVVAACCVAPRPD
jgi:hypothetical protein